MKSTLRSIATLGACLAVAATAQAQIGSLPKGQISKPGGLAKSSNQKPVCIAGPAQFIECTGQVTAVQLDGSLSYDPDGDPITFKWAIQGVCDVGTLSDPTSPTPILYFDPNNNCLDECGKISLQVRDGKQNSYCTTAVVLTDLTPPDMIAPLDVVEPFTTGYPTQADPLIQGMALVNDCDPAATLTWTDTVTTGPTPSGVEDIVHRLWRSVDECGNVREEVQVIAFLAPSFFDDAPLDVLPGSCNNLFLTGPGATTFDAWLLAESGFDAGKVQTSTLKFRRADGIGTTVTPMSATPADLGTPSIINSCASSNDDQMEDMQLVFDQTEVINKFMLNQEMGDAIVVVEVTGKDINGVKFTSYDLLRIKHLAGSGPPPTTQGDPTLSLKK